MGDNASGADLIVHLTCDRFGNPKDFGGLNHEFAPLYAGRELDTKTGLYFNRARWYDPTSARFLSEDPLGFAAGDTNLYRYVGNSPTHATDPSGMFWSWATAGTGAAISSTIYLGSAAITGKFSWAGLSAAAGVGFVAGAGVGAFLGDPSALGVSVAVMGAGAGVGAVHGGLETYAANRDAGPLEYTLGIGLGGMFGAINPVGEFVSTGGAVVGGSIDAYHGREFLGVGFQAGGLVGGVAGGFGTAARTAFRKAAVGGTRRAALYAGARAGGGAIAWETAGMATGATVGYTTTGTSRGALHGATWGMFGGGIARGARGLYRGWKASGVGPSKGMFQSGQLRGVEEATDELIDGVVGKGRTIRYAKPGSDELRYLDYMKANANVGGKDLTHILLRTDPKKIEVLEEFLHGTQKRIGVIDDIGVLAAEMHVKEFMIRHQRMLGISAEDVRILQQMIGR